MAHPRAATVSAGGGPRSACSGGRQPGRVRACANICSMAPATAQLSLDGADRLVELLEERRAPVAAGEAARCLFALRSAPAPLVRQLVDEVVAADARLTWRSAGEVALAEWEEVASLVDLPLEQAPYVVFDLETTGTRPGVSRIVEVGAVRMRGFEAVEDVSPAGRPGVPIRQTITRITGITPADLAGRAADRARADRVPAVRGRRGAGRPQRPLRRRLRRRRAVTAARRPADGAGDRHGGARPPVPGRAAAADEPGHAGGAVRHRGAALPPRAARTPRRRPRSWPCCWAWPRSGARARSATRLGCLGADRPPGPDAARAWRATCRPAPASICSGTPPSRCCTWARPPTCARACARTSGPARRGARVEAALAATERIETRPGGLRAGGGAARAGADPAAAAGRQPPRRPSRAGLLPDADRRRSGAAAGRHAAAAAERAFRWGRCRRSGRRAAPPRRCGGCSACGRAARRSPKTRSRAVWPGCWAAAPRPAAGPRRPSATPAAVGRLRGWLEGRQPRTAPPSCGRGWRRSGSSTGSRRRPRSATSWTRWMRSPARWPGRGERSRRNGVPAGSRPRQPLRAGVRLRPRAGGRPAPGAAGGRRAAGAAAAGGRAGGCAGGAAGAARAGAGGAGTGGGGRLRTSRHRYPGASPMADVARLAGRVR